MELNQIWSTYSDRMSEIELLHRSTKELANRELKKLNEYANSIKDNDQLKELSYSHHNMTFNEARTGDTRFYDQTKLSLEERYLHIILHKNKQYQWLLAEAYEEFEDYLENIYAYYGYVSNTFWPLKDYGNITLSELSSKDFSWHHKQAKNKKDAPKSILNKFRNQFPVLVTIERNNALSTNLALAITLVEKLRHIIVHKGGKVDSKEEFIKLVAQESGVFNNGSISQENTDFINLFFGENEYENLITILEVRVQPEIPLDIHVSLFSKLTNYLMAYAFLIFEILQAEQSDEENNA
jgi:hypothetical protein